MEKLKFTPNVPVQMALKYPQGKILSGRWGEQMLFTLTDGRQMYVPMDVASKINALEVNVNEPFCICKRWNGQRSQPVRWDVWLTPEAEKVRAAHEVPNETPLERQLRESLENLRKPATLSVPKIPETSPETAEAKSPAAVEDPGTGAGRVNSNGSGNGSGSLPLGPPAMARFSWAPFLLSQTEALTDVFAAALDYASRGHGNHIKPEDVRALMTTAFINLAQRGALRAG